MQVIRKKPVVLAILDGWGMSTSWAGNAIAMSNPSEINMLWKDYPHAILQAFHQITSNFRMAGNSEVGHSSIGAGKMVFQDLERLNAAINNKTFFQNDKLISACKNATNYNSSLHLVGLVSDGGIHSHIDHLFALLRLAKYYNLPKVYVHVITDGVDTRARSAIDFVKKLEEFMKEIGIGQVATIIGRHYAMSRENNFDGTSKSLSAMCGGVGVKAGTAVSAIKNAYNSGLTDQLIPPTVITTEVGPTALVSDNDSVVMFNFRPDRAKQLTLGLLGMNGKNRKIKVPARLFFVAFTSYFLPEAIQKKVNVAFPRVPVKDTLGKMISDMGLTQYRIAESEKYPHISYFLNCGQEEKYPGEEREIVQSANVRTFAEKPEMEAPKITEKLLKAINSGKYDFILVNYANVDSVGHSGDLIATTKAAECIDKQIKKIAESVLENDGTLIITADHGNAEQMIYLEEAEDKETHHTLNPVPFIIVDKSYKNRNKNNDSTGELITQMVSPKHSLADVAPTILEILGLQKPALMDGKSLISDIIK